MNKGVKALVGIAIVGGAVVGGYFLVQAVLAKKSAVDDAVAAMQTQLDELDPVSRAAAVARITTDEAKSLRHAKA
ncbi:hypothetical protein [Longivirga aurantiaca]|uniref:Uncharacterized protein n=1 Tax=Longivirga aurantiaca TaxID=1837743 RepID=A0ABW1SY70_9ACTN